MRKHLIKTLLLLLILTGCTDRESEQQIEGRWQAQTMTEVANNTEHDLPKGIHLEFAYPKYDFSGESSEEGNFYIKNDVLYLIPKDQDQQRELPILKFRQDTLILHLEDSLGSRTVEFLRY